MEDEPVGAGLDVGEVAHAAVVVGLALGDELVAAEELDAHAGGGNAPAGVEDVCRDHDGIFALRADKVSETFGLRD